jgi:lysophospholipase L1-like esterase
LPEKSTPGMTQLEAAGERRLRQLLLAVNFAIFCVIGAIALYLWRLPPGQNVYFKLQQSASFTYLFIWMGISALGAVSACHRRTMYGSLVITLLLLLEGMSHAYFYHENGRVYHPWAEAILDRFEPHPLLVGIPRPGRFGDLSHDDLNRRTTINEGKIANPRHVYVFGGSTTYDVGNVDAETWASDLSKLLGPAFEVDNYGVSGYTSLESMIQSLFVFRDIKPACAIYFLGGNDLMSSHVEGLRNDYSNYELRRQIGTLGVGYRPGFLDSNGLFLQLIFRAVSNDDKKYGPWTAEGEISDKKDLRLSGIFTENVKLIAEIDKHFGVKTIFVPQILNYDWLETHYSQAWWPFIPAKGVRPLMYEMNLDLAQVAKKSGAIFLAAPLSVGWQGSDFADQVHFSASGAAKFAASLVGEVTTYCQ